MYKKITNNNVHEIEPGASIADFPLEGIPQDIFDSSALSNTHFYINLEEADAGYLSLKRDHTGDIETTQRERLEEDLKKGVEEILQESTWWFKNPT